MGASIQVVRHGEPSRQALELGLGECKQGDLLAPVSVVVSSALAGLDLRRRLAFKSGLVNVRFSELSRLAELLGVPELVAAATGDDYPRPMSPAILGAALRTALAEEPGVFAPVAAHPSTEAALAATYRDLRQAGPRELAQLRAFGPRAADVVRLTSRARQLVAPGWYDVDDLSEAASRAVRAGRGSLEDIGPVIVYLPDLLRPSEVGLLVALAERTQVLVLLGVTGDERADSAVRALAELLGRHLGCAVLGESSPSPTAFAVSELVSAPDPEDEVREAIRRLLAHDASGGSLGRCAIAHPGSRRYGRLLAEQLAATGLAWNGPAPGTLAEAPEAQVLSGLVRLASPPAELERSAVLAWLGRGPILDRSGVAAPVGAWDRASREAGVVSGIEEWRSRLASHATRCGEHRPEGAALAVSLWEFVDQLAGTCAKLLSRSSWEGFVRWAKDVLEQYVAPPDDEVHRKIDLALDELAGLDTLEPLGLLPAAIRHDRMSRALATVLDRAGPRIGRFGRGVAVAPIASLVGVEIEQLVVVGALEGELPARTSDDPLLPSREREQVGGTSLVRERAEVRDRRHLVALLCTANRAVVTFPRVDVRQARAAVVSRWFDGDLASGAAETTIGSFAGTLHRVATGVVPACDALDWELASMQAWCEAGHSGDGHFLSDSVPGFAAALAVGRARAGSSLNRFNGLAAPVVAASDPVGERPDRLLSATTVETYTTCPFRGFLRNQLRLQDFDAPERRIRIEPMDRGSLIHGVLERLVAERLVSARTWSGWETDDHPRLATLAAEAFDDYERRGLAGKALLWELEKSQILLDLDHFLDSDDRRCKAGDRVPIAAEHRFGDDEVPPLELVAAGRAVRFRGMIDRVDRASDGSLTVVDYKTGSSGSYGVLESDPVGHGERLQLAIYGLAARATFGGGGSQSNEDGPAPAEESEGEVSAEYRFLGSGAGKESVGIKLDSHARARLGDALDTLVRLIDDGVFPARPGASDRDSYKNCQWCEFDALCSADRDRAWHRVRTDARLRDYVALVEPDDSTSDTLDLNVALDAL